MNLLPRYFVLLCCGLLAFGCTQGQRQNDDDSAVVVPTPTAEPTPQLEWVGDAPVADLNLVYLDVYVFSMAMNETIEVQVDNDASAGDPFVLIQNGGGVNLARFDNEADCMVPAAVVGNPGCPTGSHTAIFADNTMILAVGMRAASVSPAGYTLRATIEGAPADLQFLNDNAPYPNE